MSKNLSSDVVDIELNENSWRPITKGPVTTSSSNSAHASVSSSSSKQKTAEKINLSNSVELSNFSNHFLKFAGNSYKSYAYRLAEIWG